MTLQNIEFKSNITKQQLIKKKKPFIIPDSIFMKIIDTLVKDPNGFELLKHKEGCMNALAKIFIYWSLKREDCNGAPLTRRLYTVVSVT